jgi:hypothetical protein
VWEIVLLLVLITAFLIWVVFIWGGGVYQQRRLKGEVAAIQQEVQRLREINEALRRSLGAGAGSRLRQYGDLAEFVRDLESLRCAIAGSRVCQEMLSRKYGMVPGPDLLSRIMVHPGVDSVVKSRLADELLVGEVGRVIMRCLDAGGTLEKAATEAGVPLTVAKGQVTRLQILGYVDSRLKLTERGRMALL